MAFLRAIFFLLTAVAIVALGANELHRDYKLRMKRGVNKGLGREIHDNLSSDRAAGRARRPATSTKEKVEAREYSDELSRDDKSELNELIEKVM